MIEIYNPNPWMTFGGMGSKKLVGENIEYIANNDTHPGAQFNSQFHDLVKTEVAKFAAKDRLDTARAEIPRRVSVEQVPRSSKVASVGAGDTSAETTRPPKSEGKLRKPKRRSRWRR